MQHIAIIGGGITGVTTAYALAKRGLRVTLFERHRYAAMETSFANGGQISASNAEVWNHTSTILKGLKWIGDANAPLLVNPKPSWHKLSWMAEFIANIRNYERNTIATVKLAIAAREHLYSWAQEEGIPFALKRAGILHIYRNKSAFDHATKVNRLLAQGGLSRTAVSPSEMRAIEPTLKGDFVGGYFTESDATGDIHQFTVGLAAAFERLGGTICYGQQIERIQSNGATVTLTAKGSADTDTSATTSTYSDVVICAGVSSRALAKQLGDRVNIYPVKGYAITVALPDAKSQAAAPNVSLLDDEAKLVTSRLGEDRLRIAGTAEFNGYNLDIRADRIRPLVAWVNQCFPDVGTRQVVPWAGLRPMMPDMMPKVGRGRQANVFYNTGHGHLGWTLSAATASLLAEEMCQAESARVAKGKAILPEPLAST